MANTYTLISSVTVGSGGAAAMTFTSIPSTYTDLVVYVSAWSTAAGGAAANGTNIKFNNTTANRTYRRLNGFGNSVSSDNGTGIPTGDINGTSVSTIFTNQFIYIPNYAGSNNKSVSVDSVTENNGTATGMNLIAGLWSDATAINRIDLFCDANNYAQYSTAYLYGISNA